MRNKKMFLSAILLTTAMLFEGGCGKQAASVSAEPTEAVKEVEEEIPDVMVGVNDKSAESSSPTVTQE